MLSIFFLPLKSARDTSLRSLFTRWKSGALAPTLGSSPLVFTGLPRSAIFMGFSLFDPSVIRERGAAAEQVPVAVDVVRAPHRRPVLAAAQGSHGIGRLLAAVLVAPGIRGHHLGGVGRVAQGVVLPVQLALLHRADLAADGDHGLDEAVQLVLGLG